MKGPQTQKDAFAGVPNGKTRPLGPPDPSELRPFALERYLAQWEFSVPYHLCASDCESMTVAELLQLVGASERELLDLHLGYTPPLGDERLRRLIAARYHALSDDNVLVTNAPEEAIFIVMVALLTPPGNVVVQTPCYQSLAELPRWRGCQVRRWDMHESAGIWRWDLDRLAELVDQDTQMIVLNVPHNPTGHLPQPAELQAVLEVARRHDAWLFCDEMYRGLEYASTTWRVPSVADFDYPKALALSGMSKAFGLPGLRIGWLAARDHAIIERLLRTKDYTTICSSAPSQLLAAWALSQGQRLLDRSLQLIAQNLPLVRRLAGRFRDRLQLCEPFAGPVALIRLCTGTAAAFCDRVRERAGVLLFPSALFEGPHVAKELPHRRLPRRATQQPDVGTDHPDNYVRIGFGRKNAPAALAALESYLQSAAR